MCLRRVVTAVSLNVLLVATAHATTFYIDQFQVTRDGNPNWFVDNFDDGVPPPSSNAQFPNTNFGSYITLPVPLPGPEQDGKLRMESTEGAATFSGVTGDPILIQRARLVTNISNEDGDLLRGLKDVHTFEVRGLFDLIEPTLVNEFYAVRLVDFDAPDPNDNVQLRVQRTTAGEWRVRFMEADFGLGIFNELDSYLLSDVTDVGGYEQIALKLTRGDIANNLISASFELIDLDNVLSTLAVSLNGNAAIFDGERWTRAAFMTVARRDLPVPLPATLLLIGVGLAAMRCQRRRCVAVTSQGS